MILVIVGHTLPYGNLMRNFIFSFHMPAFFFLTGYTARRPDTWQGFARRVKKDFATLIVPVLGVVQVFNVLLNFFLSDDRSLTNLWDIARYNAITLFWASGNPADGIPSCGMLISAIHEEEGEERLNLIQLDASIPAGAKMY